MVRIETMKKAMPLVFLLCFLLSEGIFGMMPPVDMARRNLEATLILIGKVEETGTVLLPEKGQGISPVKGVFVLNILHVVKGYGIVKPGDNANILFRPSRKLKNGIVASTPGVIQVKVRDGDIIVAYINPSKHPGFYTPLAEGSSVVVIIPCITK